MKTITLNRIIGKSDLELLEQIYTKVKLGEFVKFNGRAYMRTRTLNTKMAKYLYHFTDCGDIYQGNYLTEDDDGEYVNHICKYKAIIKGGTNEVSLS